MSPPTPLVHDGVITMKTDLFVEQPLLSTILVMSDSYYGTDFYRFDEGQRESIRRIFRAKE